MRTIVVGDIHGCLAEFDELLHTLDHTPNDRLILVGDLVDRGPDSVGVVRRAQELKVESVQGNHEYKHLRYRKQRAEGNIRVEMNEDKLSFHDQISDDLWRWIASWPLYIRLAPQLAIIHAGLRKGFSIEQQEARTLLMMRYAMRDTGKMANMKRTGTDFLHPATAAFWTELWDGPEDVIYGHHPNRDGVGVDKSASGRTCYGIDTGCCFGRSLTAAVFEDSNFAQPPLFVEVAAKASYAVTYNEATYED